MRARLAVSALLAALVLSGPALGEPPANPATAAQALDDAAWEVRRRAESDLVALGLSAFAAPEAESAVLVRAWDAALAEAESKGGPGVAEAVARILRRLEGGEFPEGHETEPGLTDDAVRGAPRLLRARVERHLAALVVSPGPLDSVSRARSIRPAREAQAAIRLLMPEADAVLVDVLRKAEDPRLLAGAIVGGAGRTGGSDAFLDAIGATWDADPDRLVAAGRYGAVASPPPLATILLALGVTGRAGQIVRLRKLAELDRLGVIGDHVRVQLLARDRADLGLGDFLAQVDAGDGSVEEQAEAAKRALDGGLPWLARLLARRALYLDGRHAGARATLVAADEAIGLAATARADAGLPPEDGKKDDVESSKTDAALRSGRLSQRLLRRLEVGSTPFFGLAPVAAGAGFLVVGNPMGRVNLYDADSGTPIAWANTRAPALPRSLAVSGDVVAAVTARGGAYFWRATATGLLIAGTAVGPFVAVAPAPAGGFWLVDRSRVLSLHKAGGKDVVPAEGLPPVDAFVPTGFGSLEGGAVLLATKDRVDVFDPATKALRTLAEAKEGEAADYRAAPYGAGVVIGNGESYEIFDASGKKTGEGRLEAGSRITGVAGDAATSTVYLATAESLTARGASDGAVRWVEQVEGSGNPVVGRGIVAVSAGLGEYDGGDNRTERTISVLRATSDEKDPFEGDARRRAVDAAVAAARMGRPGVARALLDPLDPWLTATEKWAAKQALGEIPEPEEPAMADSPK